MPPKRPRKSQRVAAMARSESPEPKRRDFGGQSEAGESGRSTDPDENINSNTRGLKNVDSSSSSSKNLTSTKIKCSALENSVKQYSGTQTGCPKEWIATYERFSLLKGWDNETKGMAMPLYLKDTALSWYEEQEETLLTDFKSLKHAFLDRFQLTRTQILTELDVLAARKQARSETVDEYLADIARKCKRLKRTKDQEFECALQGLLPHIKQHVLLQQPETIEDIRRVGALCELVHVNVTQNDNDNDLKDLVASLREEIIQQKETIQKLQARQVPVWATQQSTSGSSNCTWCGYTNCKGKSTGDKTKCPAYGKTCAICKKLNHFAKACKTQKRKSPAESGHDTQVRASGPSAQEQSQQTE